MESTQAGRVRRSFRPGLSWIFIGYAALVLAIGWAYASLRIHSDREQTLEGERNRLRFVAAALETGVQAMLNDGVGAAVAAANAAAPGGLQSASDDALATALSGMFAGSSDIDSLFLWGAGRFVRVDRSGARVTATVAPGWLWTPGSTASGTNWVGRAMRDPALPDKLVIPIARYFAYPGGGVWAGALFDFRAFDDLYARLGQNLRVMSLVASDGAVLLRIPALPDHDLANGVNVASSAVFRDAMARPGSGVVEGEAPILNVPMMFGFERVAGYEMILTVGQARAAVLAPWRDRRRAILGVTAASSVLLVIMTALLSHYFSSRRRAERTLMESEGRYRALVDALPEAVFVHRSDRLLFMNDTAVRLVGAHCAAQLLGRSVLGFVAPPDRPTIVARLKRVNERAESVPPTEVRIETLAGRSMWAEVQSVPVVFSGEPAVQTVLRDVTAQKSERQAEAARAARIQQQSRTLLRLASREGLRGHGLQAALDEICVEASETMHADRATVWLRQGEEFTLARDCAHTGSSVAARTWAAADAPAFCRALTQERVIEANRAAEDERMREMFALGVVAGSTSSVLAAALRRSGEPAGVIVFEWAGPRGPDLADELGFVAGVADQAAQILVDTEREQALADLRALTGELMRSQDEERRRIGRDLHDATGQTLAALEIGLGRLANSGAVLPAGQDVLELCTRLAAQCSREIRTASYLLHPPLLDDLGLVSALRWLADGLRERAGIDVRLDLPDSMVRLAREEELTLFRVAQEALTNVQRHAASPWASIRLSVEPGQVVLEIRDGGRGIRRAHGGDSAFTLGVGLAGMRERIRQIGGAFTMEASGSGTVVRASVPVETRAAVEGERA